MVRISTASGEYEEGNDRLKCTCQNRQNFPTNLKEGVAHPAKGFNSSVISNYIDLIKKAYGEFDKRPWFSSSL